MILIAGPCAVESAAQIEAECAFLANCGLRYVRGGAFKPRTRPDSFQGLGWAGVEMLADAARRYKLQTVSEVTDTRLVEQMARLVDVLQLGARNMQNFDLLREAGRTGKTILLKRGLAATLDEWYGAADYVLAGGATVWLCERGHRTYMPHVRFMLDVAAIADARRRGYTVLADPSHAAGRRVNVPPLALAALAAGAHGLLIEVHAQPDHALSDAEQQLNHDEFARLLAQTKELRHGD